MVRLRLRPKFQQCDSTTKMLPTRRGAPVDDGVAVHTLPHLVAIGTSPLDSVRMSLPMCTPAFRTCLDPAKFDDAGRQVSGVARELRQRASAIRTALDRANWQSGAAAAARSETHDVALAFENTASRLDHLAGRMHQLADAIR